MDIIRTFELEIPGKTQRFQFDLASDNHWGANFEDSGNGAAEGLSDRIIRDRGAEQLFLAGDNINGSKLVRENEGVRAVGADNHEAVNILLERVAAHYKRVFFLAGNHDLRRFPLKENPWEDIKTPNNVVMPVMDEPIMETAGGVRMLLGNIFFDLQFIDSRLIGLTEKELREYYDQEVVDGKSLLQGGQSIALFRNMTRQMVKSLTAEVDLVATHALPHPSLTMMLLAPERLTEEMIELRDKEGVPFVFDMDKVKEKAAKYSKRLKREITPEKFMDWWNKKALIMGSNILSGDFKPGLVSIYGHNHRGGIRNEEIRGKTVTFVSHQVYCG